MVVRTAAGVAEVVEQAADRREQRQVQPGRGGLTGGCVQVLDLVLNRPAGPKSRASIRRPCSASTRLSANPPVSASRTAAGSAPPRPASTSASATAPMVTATIT